MAIIEVQSLTRNYGENRGNFDINIQVEKEETFGYLGSNGAGKTTTIRHLMGFLKAKEGSCTILGMDCWKEREKILGQVGYIPGEISFFGEMTAKKYFSFMQKYRGDKESRLEDLISFFELEPSQKIQKLSKGNKQKVAIITGLMHNPRILILDEPTSGLDPLMQIRFVEWIQREKAEGKTILLSSHIFEEVEKTCDRVGILSHGSMVVEDTIDNLREKHLNTCKVYLETVEEAAAFSKDFQGV